MNTSTSASNVSANYHSSAGENNVASLETGLLGATIAFIFAIFTGDGPNTDASFSFVVCIVLNVEVWFLLLCEYLFPGPEGSFVEIYIQHTVTRSSQQSCDKNKKVVCGARAILEGSDRKVRL